MKEPEIGELVIGHQDGPLRYEVKSARFGITSPHKRDGQFHLWLDIKTEDPAPDHPMVELGPPSLRAGNIYVKSPRVAPLLGKTIEFEFDSDAPFSYRATYANLYISHHTHPQYNRITIDDRSSGKLVLNWEGECEDINYYDDRAKANMFHVRCSLTQALELDVEAIRERGAYVWEEGTGRPFSFYQCPNCKRQFMLGICKRRDIRYYLDPDELTRVVDARKNISVCPDDGTKRDSLEELSFHDILEGPWAWAIR